MISSELVSLAIAVVGLALIWVRLSADLKLRDRTPPAPTEQAPVAKRQMRPP